MNPECCTLVLLCLFLTTTHAAKDKSNTTTPIATTVPEDKEDIIKIRVPGQRRANRIIPDSEFKFRINIVDGVLKVELLGESNSEMEEILFDMIRKKFIEVVQPFVLEADTTTLVPETSTKKKPTNKRKPTTS
ncbi:unnamed protein product [Owenia fusiformis]|uniref:Uncharacterized protein n=1 Tax=Owenia fusiformis TaxID=6347 RepID=A0A8S4MVT2_OWEFU|nr:unnamed protein product [Owenia fusiformis]